MILFNLIRNFMFLSILSASFFVGCSKHNSSPSTSSDDTVETNVDIEGLYYKVLTKNPPIDAIHQNIMNVIKIKPESVVIWYFYLNNDNTLNIFRIVTANSYTFQNNILLFDPLFPLFHSYSFDPIKHTLYQSQEDSELYQDTLQLKQNDYNGYLEPISPDDLANKIGIDFSKL